MTADCQLGDKERVEICWNFLRKRWLDREQELITVIQERTKRTEEKEEAGYRSPTWSIPRALQKINKAKRLEGETVMSALKSMDKTSSQTAASKPNPKQERRRIRKEAKGSQCAGKGSGDRATSNAREQRVCFVLGSPRLPYGRRAKSSFKESDRRIRRKRRMSSAIERKRTRLLDGHRDRHARRLWVSGPSYGR